MRTKTKYIFSTALLATIFILGFISFGLYFMEIEDHYGDLQEFYYKSQDGDIVLNAAEAQFGVLEKDWKRIYVRQGQNKTELYNWIYREGFQDENLVYRTNLKISELESMDYLEIKNYIKRADLEPLVRN